MRKSFILVLAAFLLHISFSAHSQNGTGLLWEDDNYEQVERLGGGMKFTSKDKVRNSLKDHCPTPGSQGQVGSCVGWASGYGALTINTAYQLGITDRSKIDQMAHSAMYVYNQIKVGGCDAGSRITDALSLLEAQGDCLASDFNPVTDCREMPSSDIKRRAEQYRIKDYGTLFGMEASQETKVGATISSIDEGKAVVIGMITTPSFVNLSSSTWNPSSNEQNTGGHAMTVIGYDNMRKVFEVLNSWGTSWGNDGFFFITYDDYAKYVKYGYQVLVKPNASPSDPINLSGEFVFKKFSHWDDAKGVYIFKDVSPILQGNHYTLRDGTIKKDDYFRIIGQNMKKDSYVYIFSIKPDGSAEILYPSDEAKDVDGTTIKPLPRVVNETASVVIPDGDSGMTTDQTGTDFLCILYSDKKIDGLEGKVRNVKNASGNFADRLKRGFGSSLMSGSEVDYSDGIMKATGRSTNGAYIVPLVLKVEVK